MATIVQRASALEQFVGGCPAAAVYFSGPDCGVCIALEPKIEALLAERFPEISLVKVNVEEAAALAAQYSVFTVPTLLVFFDGRETIRLSRAFSPAQLQERLRRPYDLLFGGKR